MTTIENALLDRCLARVLDHDNTPLTKGKLLERCSRDVRHGGRQAKTDVYLKGNRGAGLKKHRSIFPSGPLGEVIFGDSGRLYLEFSSLALLGALGGPSAQHSALATHYLQWTKPPYPDTLSLPLAMQLAQQISEFAEIAEDVVEAIWSRQPRQWSSHAIALHLLQVEDEAKKRRWKRVDLAKWKSVGLTLPVLDPPARSRPTAQIPPRPPKSPGVVFRVTERHAGLLRLFDRADEDGKQHIEQAARFAAGVCRSTKENEPIVVSNTETTRGDQ